jgi:NADPH-dependent ferric siderophore reductase
MQTAPAARRPGGRFLDLFSVTGTVTQLEPIARRMVRIRIEGDEVSALEYVPGQHVRVHVADLRDPRSWLRPRDLLRTYSVWQHDDGIELCVLDHGGDGPGEQWARGVHVGDSVTFNKPEGHFVLRESGYHVFAGDETAAVAFGAMLRALPPAVPACGIVEADEPADRLPIGDQLTWEYRNGRSAAASPSLLDAFTRLELPDEPGTAYLAGEARTVQSLRRHLVADRGWPRQAVLTKPFWTPGKRGLD